MRIPDRLLQLIGGAYLLFLGAALLKGIKDGLSKSSNEAPSEVPLATTHPAVPTNMFSATLEKEDKPHLRQHQSDRWLLRFGDKLCHSTGSLLVYLSQGLKTGNSEARRGLFPLYLQAALAETRLQMNARGMSQEKGDAMLDCIATTILDTPLTQLDRYADLLGLDEDSRRDTVARQAAGMVEAANGMERHFRAAYVLLRTIVLVMASERW